MTISKKMSRRRSWALASGFFAIAIAALGLSAYSGASSSQGFAPVQPVNFPHPRHVKQLGMNCLYCHYSATRSPDPGLVNYFTKAPTAAKNVAGARIAQETA